MPSVKKLKVGFVFDDSLDSTDGVAQYVKTLGGWLSSEGHSVHYLVGETKLASWAGGKVHSLSKNAPVEFNKNRLSIPLPASRKLIRRIVVREEFDILHVQMPYSPFMAGRVIREAGPSTAIIGTFHIFPAGVLSKSGTRGLKVAYHRTLKRFDKVISVSEPAAEFARSSLGLNSQILSNVIDTKHLTVKNPSTDGRTIVFLGRLVPRKGALELLKAFRILHSSHPEYRLIVAGDGPEREKLEKYTKRAKLEQSISFLGRVSEADKPKLLSSATIACFPATAGESFGIVLLEAMAAGSRVVLGGDNPGYRSVLGPQPDLLVDPKDSVRFAQRLKRLLASPEKQTALSAWQKQEVQKYDVGVIGRQLYKIYKEAIAQRSQKSDNQVNAKA